MNIFDTIIIQPILNLLMIIYALVPNADLGISIIAFTIIIRFLLLPLFKKQIHQAQIMRKIQPELKALRDKYKKVKVTTESRQAQGLEMMQIYSKYKINPFTTVAIALIQIPIIIGVYQVVQIFAFHQENISKHIYGFVGNLEPIKNLLNGSTHFNQNFLNFIDLSQHAISSKGVIFPLIILALVTASLQYMTSKMMQSTSSSNRRIRDILAEAADGKEADQLEINNIMMQKMLKFMPIMFFFMMINLPGALVIYFTTGGVVAFLQTKVILKNVQDKLPKIKDESNIKRIKNAKNAQIVTKKSAKSAKSEQKITRIKAKG